MPKPDESEEVTTPTGANDIRTAVETAGAEDEIVQDDEDQEEQVENSEEEDDKSKDDASDSDDSEDDENDSDDDEEKDEDKDKDDAPVERKFKNLAADDDAGYITNLERAYENSSAEGVRLSNELAATNRRVDAIIAAAQKDPDLAKRLNDVLDGSGVVTSSGKDGQQDGASDDQVSPIEDPFLVNAKTEWQEKSRQEVEDILAANPELLSDPKLNTQVKHWMEVFSQEELRNNKRLMSGGEAMLAAMRYLGVEDKRKKQDVANKAKSLAAPSKPTKSRTPKPQKATVSDAALDLASKMGVSRETVEKYANK